MNSKPLVPGLATGIPLIQHFPTIFLCTEEVSFLVPQKAPACMKNSWPQMPPASSSQDWAIGWVLELEEWGVGRGFSLGREGRYPEKGMLRLAF